MNGWMGNGFLDPDDGDKKFWEGGDEQGHAYMRMCVRVSVVCVACGRCVCVCVFVHSMWVRER